MLNSTTDELSSGPAVEVRDLAVSRGRNPVLHGLTFSMPRGAVVGLMGPSGCGKTTLMRTLVGVQKIDAGTVRVLEHAPTDGRLRHQVGYVTQAVSVYRDLTVRQNVSYFAALQGFSGDAVNSAIDAVGLSDLAERTVENLSGGQASRASLACALVGNPQLLVLDEPTVGLDPVTREGLWAHLRSLADQGATLLISSHVMDEAAKCDTVLLMRDGRLLAHVTPADLLARTRQTSMDEAFLALIRQGGHR